MISVSGKLICSNQIEVELVSSLLPEHSRLPLSEPGCLNFLVRRTSDPLIWHVEEAFTDRAAYEAHQSRMRTSSWYKATAHLKRDYRISGI